MGKQKASSASTATRKKHAKKAAGEDASTGNNTNQTQAGRSKGAGGKGANGKGKKNAEPRVKMYIPPVKPQALQRDPVDILRLATSLPPDLLVVFRKLTKKDAVTRRRALEELLSGWFEKLNTVDGDDEERDVALAALGVALPAWCFHFPALSLHPSKRIRFLAATIQANFLETPWLRDLLWSFLKQGMDVTRLEGYYGAWMLSSNDVDRQVCQVAQPTWNMALQSFEIPTDSQGEAKEYEELARREFIQRLESFVLHAIMHPQSLYAEFYPSSVTGPTDPTTDPMERMRMGESEEERAGDRDSRIRIAALAALKAHIGISASLLPNFISLDISYNPIPEESGHSSFTQTSNEEGEDARHRIRDLFRNPEFWSILYPGKVPPYMGDSVDNDSTDGFEAFGMNQPGIRRAGWTLVHLLAASHLDNVQEAIPLISAATLRSIWIEPDAGVRVWSRDGLLTLLSNVPESWNMASSFRHHGADDCSSDEDEDRERPSTKSSNAAYDEFLQFLRLGCGGSAVQFYPAIVVIVSKLPESLLPQEKESMTALFDALWAAVDGHALNVLERGSAPIMAFVNAHMETLVLLVGRLCQPQSQPPPPDGTSTTSAHCIKLGSDTVTSQVKLLWEYFVTKKLVVRAAEFGMGLGRMFLRLQNINSELFDAGWAVITSTTELLYGGSNSGSEVPNGDFSAVFKSLYTLITSTPRRQDVVSLISGLIAKSLDGIVRSDATLRLYVDHLDLAMRDMSEVLADDPSLTERLQHLFSQHLTALSTRVSSREFSRLVTAYLVFLQKVQQPRRDVWHSVLSLLGKIVAPETTQEHGIVLHELLIATSGQDFGDLRGEGELRSLLQLLLEQSNTHLAEELIRRHERFLSTEDLDICTTFLVGKVEEASSLVLRQAGYQITDTVHDAVHILSVVQEVTPSVIHRMSWNLPGPLFVFRCIYPLVNGEVGSSADLDFWDDQDQKTVLESLVREMRSWILDPELCVSSEILVRAAMMIPSKDASWVLNSIFPSKEILERLFAEEIAISPDPILAADDLLVPEEEPEDLHARTFDKQQLSSYARLVWALTFLASTDRQVAKTNMWMLKHSLLLQQMAEDRLQTTRSQMSPFGPEIPQAFLLRIVESARMLTVYLFSGVSSSDLPHGSLVDAIDGKTTLTSADIVGFISDLCRSSVYSDHPKFARVVRSVLSHGLRGISATDADKWLTLSRKIRRIARNTGLAIVSAIVGTDVETPLLARMRNEAASELASIPASKANGEGSSPLLLLLVLAPLPDSDAVFIPSQRAIMVIQTIERWIGSDEDVDPVIESRTLSLLCHLAPILQSVVGRHWDFAFDLAENTLENSSLGDLESLVQLSRALDLISTIAKFASTNKQLSAVWSTRRTVILRLVRDLISAKDTSLLSSGLQDKCRSQSINILQEPPEGIIEAKTLSKMAYLLQVPSMETQRGAYPLVRSAAQKYSENIVLEVGLNPTADIDARLPMELMSLLETVGLWDDAEETDGQETEHASTRFGTLLGWMAVLDAFENTSFRVRSSYVEQLRNSGVIQNALIPGICDFLQLGKPGKKPLKLDLWEVDRFFIPLYEHESIRILAAHVYYRALTAIPSLIRTWWTDCKDRQLSTAFATSTAAYFSPVLVASELVNLREPSGAGGREKLEDDAFTIKVSQAISEVSVIYLVDEQQMEMAIKLPAEYPLKLVEVRDVRRVGVAEDKWRGWLFAVQQIISTQNGHIADALALFKKNVTLHFEGQVECAICYSIISVTDLQLPTKPCKTCKNRFHASCLYKWFKSSSSSSCPLCRSDIF